MTTGPFTNFFQARDAFNAEIRTGKHNLTGPENAVFRVCLENTLYKPGFNEADYGFLPDDYVGIENISTLTSYGETAVKTALKGLKAKGLISTFKRPIISGGRYDDRIRVDWLIPEEALGDSSYETRDDSSEESRDDSSIYKEEEVLEEVTEDNNSDVVLTSPSGETLDLRLLATTLGVKSLRANLKSLANSLAASYGAAVVLSVAEVCMEKGDNTAGLFVSSAEDMCELHVAHVQRSAAVEAAAQPDPQLRMIPVPDGVKVYGGPVKGATEKVAVSGLDRNTGRYKQFRLRIVDRRDKIGYVTPEHYEILVEHLELAA